MAEFTDQAKQHFPLQDIKSVVALFRSELTSDAEPNLGMLSVVIGMIENSLTSNRAAAATHHANESDANRAGIEPIFPVIELPSVEALYCKFETQMKGSVDLSEFKSNYATRDLVKKVSDIVWSSLSRQHYKERAHLQSLFSYLTGNRLDCFGVAFAVVAACQILGYKDVHLALSEDHAWVVYGEAGDDTAEVTWHGKGNEDKRGQPISLGVAERSWLYLNGHPVICTRHIEIAALVSAINPSVTSTVDSVELASLQQELLWLLYDMGHLKKYPMALGNLGDLESIDPTPDRPSTYDLFKEAIKAGQEYYDDHHVYPYTYLGGHSYRQRQYKEALEQWALAANVVSRYNYSREDEEVYKEFLEIANDLIPYIVKTGSTGESRVAANVLRDPECYSYVLRFYDGICKWEEGSATPILHITWAKHFIASVTKFVVEARHRIDVGSDDKGEDGEEGDKEKEEKEGNGKENGKMNVKEEEVEEKKKGKNEEAEEDINKNIVKEKTLSARGKRSEGRSRQKKSERRRGMEQDSGLNIEVLEASCAEESMMSTSDNINTTTAEETDSMMSTSDPINTTSGNTTNTYSSHLMSCSWDAKTDFNDFLSTRSNGSAFPGMTMESVMKAESPAEMAFQRRLKAQMSSEDEEEENDEEEEEEEKEEEDSDSSSESTSASFQIPPPKVSFRSHKMWGLKEILTTSGKLNTAAIQLQLTAQSQTTVNKRPRAHNDYEDFGTLRRRPRRF